MKYEIGINGNSLQLDIQRQDNLVVIHSELGKSVLDVVPLQENVYSVIMNNHSFVVAVESDMSQRVVVNGTPFDISLLDAIHLHLRDLGWESASETRTGQVVTQIPGLITQIFHQVGDEVDQDEPLLLMEAMKMENEIKAPMSGVIQRVHVKQGQTVEKGTMIVEIG
ncbi:MAG: acetyl-CoA carboxylase biotin carboxyl carrier protein subunit [Candidatus Marinimicrobia bacterium]|nr:acetyl-CoA carboxylase biotin carboxyl carrier protein subunit [Candidatus Neomarinimicrobiota bacterium]MCF7850823.1 acetyl-CoA carboxylase biotin carboxyl carrier protein subunit [Candidatus Neomarinimicrobiota bacterium]MCF7904757.1 acetyl-CoA carboxylase biotin carboxyl carrier protein subunit [Candidatus Neomarinimicrobiota bacterium]